MNFNFPNPYDYKYDRVKFALPLPFDLLSNPDLPTPQLQYQTFHRQWVNDPVKGRGAVWCDESGQRYGPVCFGEKVEKKLEAPVMGVREWNVERDGRLSSTGVGRTWSSGVQKARCHDSLASNLFAWPDQEPHPRGHKAPHRECRCGLYAFYTQDALIKHGDSITHKRNGVSGVVSAWGRVIRAEYGFRAEYMKLEALIIEEPKRSMWGTTVDFTEAYESLAKRHGATLIRSYEVSAFMGLSGGTVLECEAKPPPSINHFDSPMPAYLKAQSYTPARHEVARHYDVGAGKAWIEYSDGTTAPLDLKSIAKGGQNG